MGNMSYVAGLEAFAKAAAETLGHEVFQKVMGEARLSLSLGGCSHDWANLESALTMINDQRAFVECSQCRIGQGADDGAIPVSH